MGQDVTEHLTSSPNIALDLDRLIVGSGPPRLVSDCVFGLKLGGLVPITWPKSCGDGLGLTISVPGSGEQCLVNSLSVRSHLGPLLTIKTVRN